MASKNTYVYMFLARMNQMKDETNIFVVIKNAINHIYVFFDKVYYRYGVWISYFVSIVLTLMMSITLIRFILLFFIFLIFLVHLESLRRSYDDGYLRLGKVYRLWRIYGVLKVFGLTMVIFGTFIL